MNQIDKVEGGYSLLFPSLSLLFMLAFLYLNEGLGLKASPDARDGVMATHCM